MGNKFKKIPNPDWEDLAGEFGITLGKNFDKNLKKLQKYLRESDFEEQDKIEKICRKFLKAYLKNNDYARTIFKSLLKFEGDDFIYWFGLLVGEMC